MDSVQLQQDDLRAILDALGISTHARPYSPHEVVQREVLPAITALRAKVARVVALREDVRAEQNRCCIYGTTHGDGRTCDCKFPFPGRTNSEATGCPERRRFIDQIDRALTGPTER